MKNYIFLFLILLSLSAFSQSNIEVGEKAPEIHITDWIANTPADKQLSGKFIVLEFWATWCGPCIKAVPHMNELQEKFEREDLYFLSITDESVEKVKRTLKRVNFQSAVVSDQSGRTQINYGDGKEGLANFPMTVLIDNSGIVKWIGLPNLLTAAVMQDFLEGALAPFNHFNNESSSVSIKNISIIEEDPKVESEGETPNEMGGLKNLVALVSNKNILYHFDFRKAGKEVKSQSRFGNLGLSMTAVTLPELLAEISEIDPGQIRMPERLRGEKYSLIYKNTKSDVANLQHLESNVLEALQLKKKVLEKKVPVYKVSVKDETLLEEALETEFSSKSDAGKQLLFGGYTLPAMITEINEISDALFTIESSDETKYDFIIEKSSTEEILESLRSYGLAVKEDLQTTKVIKLEVKE